MQSYETARQNLRDKNTNLFLNGIFYQKNSLLLQRKIVPY